MRELTVPHLNGDGLLLQDSGPFYHAQKHILPFIGFLCSRRHRWAHNIAIGTIGVDKNYGL